MFWYLLLICKGSLTSSLYIDSCWVYVILKWLTFLWYVYTCVEGASHLLLYIAYYAFMWLGFSHLFSYKCMYAGGVNFTSLLFMNVYNIYTFIVWFMQKGRKILFMPFYCLYPFVEELTKRGRDILEDILEFYICMFVYGRYFGVLYMHVCLYACLFKFVIFYHWYQEHLLLVSRVFIDIKSNIF